MSLKKQTSQLLRLIDADVHNTLVAAGLLPHLPTYWCEVVSQRGTGTPGVLTGSRMGVLRSDAVPPSGGAPGSDPKLLAQHHLDKYNIGYAILTGSGILDISLNPDVDYDNAVASAYGL